MKTVLFGGTAEGRALAERLMRDTGELLVCVTSEYARALLPGEVNCRVGVLDEQAMLRLLADERPDRVIDATHPFAVRVTENIRRCCSRLGIACERVERSRGDHTWQECVEWVKDTAGAVKALERTQGNVLLTTGSHTLAKYAAALPAQRLYARVLPTSRVLSMCEELNLLPGHVIAMQGPFTAALNAALYDMLDIRAMVSKDSGAAGGVPEKVLPALERGIHVIMIARPAGGGSADGGNA